VGLRRPAKTGRLGVVSWFYEEWIRPALFLQDSERIHDRTLGCLAGLAESGVLCDAVRGWLDVPGLPVRAFGLGFPNPLGLAAGMDKAAVAVPVWEALGFGFSELGGVTAHAQPGNPEPRMFRVPTDEALINRMGFNNPGAEALGRRLEGWRARGRWPTHPVGINLGKSKVTPLDRAAEDYAASFRRLWGLADFFVVNVSSPNTPNLRQLQDRGALDAILELLQEVNAELATDLGRGLKPILVKVAPDLSWEALDDVVSLVGPRGLAGLVATNTTLSRPETSDPVGRLIYRETGGLSGGPLRDRSTAVIRHLHRQTGGRVPIIGVGGIFGLEDAWAKVLAGATLLQVYSGLVYRGPGLPLEIVSGLRERLGGASWESVVGSGK